MAGTRPASVVRRRWRSICRPGRRSVDRPAGEPGGRRRGTTAAVSVRDCTGAGDDALWRLCTDRRGRYTDVANRPESTAGRFLSGYAVTRARAGVAVWPWRLIKLVVVVPAARPPRAGPPSPTSRRRRRYPTESALVRRAALAFSLMTRNARPAAAAAAAGSHIDQRTGAQPGVPLRASNRAPAPPRRRPSAAFRLAHAPQPQPPPTPPPTIATRGRIPHRTAAAE